MTTPLRTLQSVQDFLATRDWRHLRDTARFSVFAPPEFEKETGSYELLVPRNPAAGDFARALEGTIDAIASFYQMPFSSVEALLIPSSEVVSVKLEGEGFQGGAAPFPRFERMLEHLKRTITRTAAFVLTDDPLATATPRAAYGFLNECWFLQTARGSFVARVALPVDGSFSTEPSLFAEPVQPIPREAVADTLRSLSVLVAERVLGEDESLFSEEGLQGVRQLASVAVLEEIARLLRGTEAKSVTFRFTRGSEERATVLPSLSDERLYHLDRFIAYLRDKLHATFDLTVQGRVFEIRRSRRRSSSSFVGILAEVEGRQQLVTFKVGPSDLPVFLEHFRSRRPVVVSGRARRLRTQIRIETNLSYDIPMVLPQPPRGDF